MFVADCLQVNKQGHLCMEELDVLELAAKYGTPLYVMSETQIRKNCRMYQDSLKRFYGGNGLALYASKAFCCKEICPRFIKNCAICVHCNNHPQLTKTKINLFKLRI